MARILVVEDEFAIAETLRDVLTFEGHEVDVCADGALAIVHLGGARPDVVLLDYMMPNKDGIQVLRWIREQPALHDLPVVLSSAAELTRLPGAELATAVLRKPYDLRMLEAILKRILPGS